MIQLPPRSSRFPYTTLFRSLDDRPLEMHPRADDAAGPAEGELQRVLAVVNDDEHAGDRLEELEERGARLDRKSTRLNSSHANISYAVFCLKKKLLRAYPIRV